MKILLALLFFLTPLSYYGQQSATLCSNQSKLEGVDVFALLDIEPQYNGKYNSIYEAIEYDLDFSNLQTPKNDPFVSYVSLLIDTNGDVVNACILESQLRKGLITEYDKRAVEFAMTLKYTPGIHNDIKRHSSLILPIDFDSKKIKKFNRKKKN